LGNSVSEIDPTYALQNAPDPTGLRFSQVDNAGIDVRLTQLRNLLTGTRPATDRFAPTISADNGDANWVLVDGARYYLPNKVADAEDYLYASNPSRVLRQAAPVPGRWGEAHLVPGAIDNPVTPEFNNFIRAGRSCLRFDPVAQKMIPCDAADDNFN